MRLVRRGRFRTRRHIQRHAARRLRGLSAWIGTGLDRRIDEVARALASFDVVSWQEKPTACT
jgi:hypothetical protein